MNNNEYYNKSNVVLNHDFVTGLTDAEGSFSILIKKDHRAKFKFNVGLSFRISMLKRNKMFSVNLSNSRKGKKLGIRFNNVSNISKVITTETKLKMSSRCIGISVKVLINLIIFYTSFQL
jgi:hypothetical protein